MLDAARFVQGLGSSFSWAGAFAWLVKAKPVQLVKDGKIDRRAMRRANLSTDDLHEAIRMEQFEKPDNVHVAMLEGSGKVSVVPKRHV